MKTLFKKGLILCKEMEKTNLPFAFSVPEGTKALEIHFSYAPKRLENEEEAKAQIRACLAKDGAPHAMYTEEEIESYLPLVNLVTLSLDAPSGYRGCAHRHANVQMHRISETGSSEGFENGKIEAGTWRAVLHVHALVTPTCRCQLEIEAEGAE